ncbi:MULTISPECIES: bacteriohemerythrin [unclassified Wenzhouxiangella]|uniref:bacteriohemerythrin n=1 Tax=unclassified Wenzhouxiangella TaxID=2613841 RepID=UPI000E327B29|nr:MULTISPECIES: bacteriohemerythrin [unclassified Wenzhouxiangella]RFF28385.1 EAL domain-containing protein [Wenzhouxiangella sp. 15181]RFP69901.1 EAL domain-containing protein [Wenzhouxiangella sp. 15190]
MHRTVPSGEDANGPAFEIFPWSKHFETGIADIDQQHRRLVSLLNQVASAAVDDSTDINLDELLDELTAYAHYHFEDEEALWARYLEGEKVLADHRKYHSGFVEKVGELYQSRKCRRETLHEILSFLTHWLARHILQNDREMALIIEQMDQGASVDEARLEAHRQLRQASPVILDTVLNMHQQLSRQTLELIEERKARSRAEAELGEALQRRAEDRYRAVFDSSADAIVVFDVDAERVLDVNESACKLFGQTREELVGRHVTELHPPELKDEIGSEFDRFIESATDFLLVETRIRRGDGTELPVEISGGQQFAGPSGQNAVAIFRDISSRLEARRELEYIAYHDPLTGLGNRAWIVEAIAESMVDLPEDNAWLAVMELDIDQFRHINDVHGQVFGDELLVRLARRWEALLGSEARLARLGGDEFVVLVPKVSDRGEVHRLASRLMKAGEKLLRIDGKTLSVSFSAGIRYCSANSPIEPDLLLRQANQAMYQAKLKGRSRYEEFDVDRESIIQQQHLTINAVRAALDNQELTIHYQPQVNSRTGRILGVEALLRWQHPEQGLLSPAAFLPAIESHPFSIQLGEWVIETALRQMRIWNQQDLHLAVGVNIGSLQLQDNEFPSLVERLLNKYPEIDPRSIEFEVLESGALEDLERAIDNLNALRALGVSISIDDFGTGYASLTYLKQIPAHVLKIDRSFVHDMLEEADELPLLLGIITMADSFGMEVLAEGVETAEHARLLLELGCEQAQGYAIARPMPPDQVPAWVEQWEPDPGWKDVLPILRSDLAGLSAISAHRRWFNALQSQENEPPRAQSGQAQDPCELQDWLNSLQPRSSSSRQASLIDETRRLHTLMLEEAGKLVGVTVADDRHARFERVQAVNNELVDTLRALLQWRARRALD